MVTKSLTIEQRLDRLEKAVFGSQRKSESKTKDADFSGPTGGVRFLISRGFFNKKQSLAAIKKAMADNDYHYSLQAVQMAVMRLSKTNGLLVSFKEGGKKLYAKRK